VTTSALKPLNEESTRIARAVNALAFDQHWRTLKAETIATALGIPFGSMVTGEVLEPSGARGKNYDSFVSGALICAGQLGVGIVEELLGNVAAEAGSARNQGIILPEVSHVTETVFALLQAMSKFPAVAIALELFNSSSYPERQRLVAAFARTAHVSEERASAALNICLATLMGGAHATAADANVVASYMVSAVYHVCGVELPDTKPALTPTELLN
jgi:hypothetical protein